MKQEYDYIIVGQGLAGSCLALQLLWQGKKVIVFNEKDGKSASRVAGGLINPITGRKMVLTWRAKELFPYLKTFYKKAEKELEATSFYEMPIYRPFVSIEEQNEWQGKSTEKHFAPFIKEVVTKNESEDVVNDPFGGLLLANSGYLDTSTFLDSVAKRLKIEDGYIGERFNTDLINFTEDGVVYNNIVAKQVIFCDGVAGNENPYFGEIKYRPVKGEVLKIELEANLNKIYNRGVFVMPREGLNTVGSNYNHQDLTWQPTEAGGKEIETKLQALLKLPYTIKEHKAGVRPSVSDRRPVLGASRENSHVLVFNGLGTKGVSLAPFFSNQLANWLCNGEEIDQEVSVKRFFS